MVLLALPPADHLLIERERGQFVPSRRRRMMANARAERLLKIPAAAYPRRCSSNASGLHGRNSARILGILATFQRDNLRRHFGVRVLSPQPRSRVSVARLSRSWALRVLGLDRGRVCRVPPHGYALGTLVASAEALPATIRYTR